MNKLIPYCENPALGMGAPDCSEDCCNFGSCHKDAYFKYLKETNMCEKCRDKKNEIKSNDIVKHGYWTGRTFIDDAHYEGFPPHATEEQKKAIRENDKHVTHCSVCGAMFDDRYISSWKVCPCCISIMDLERPANAYYLAWEERMESIIKTCKKANIDMIDYNITKYKPQCPMCQTDKYINQVMGSHAESHNGINSYDDYVCEMCGGEFSIHYESKDNKIQVLDIKYRKERIKMKQ